MEKLLTSRHQHLFNSCMLQAVTLNRLVRSLSRLAFPMLSVSIKIKLYLTKQLLSFLNFSTMRFLIVIIISAMLTNMPKRKLRTLSVNSKQKRLRCWQTKPPMEKSALSRRTTDLSLSQEWCTRLVKRLGMCFPTKSLPSSAEIRICWMC